MMRRVICYVLVFCFMLFFVPVSEADSSIAAYCIRPIHSDLIISESHSDEWMNVAGLTKLPAVLTLCLAFDKGLIDENASVNVSAKAASIDGPSAYLERGETIAANELIRAAVMISAGDAIYALAEHAFGSEEVFLNNIQLTLRSIGLDKELPGCLGTYMTFSCKELIALGEAATESPTFMKFASLKYAVLEHASGRKTELASSNKLLNTLPGCIGLFTGSSKSDGYCGVFACKRSETVYVCAVIGAPNSKSRFQKATELFEEAFATYRYVSLCDPETPVIENYPLESSEKDSIDLYVKEEYSLLLNKLDGDPQKKYDLPDCLSAPLDPNHAVGSISFCDPDGKILLEAALYPKESVLSNGYKDILKRVFTVFLNS